MPRTFWLYIGSGTDVDPVEQWDTNVKLFSLVEACVLLSAVLVNTGLLEAEVFLDAFQVF